MTIKDLEINKGFNNLIVECVEILNEGNKDGRDWLVVKIKDSNNEENSLMVSNNERNDNIKRVKDSIGKKVNIVSGYCREYEGNKSLTLGKFGYVTKIE